MLLRNILGRMICFDGEDGGSGGGTPPVVPPTPPADPPKTFTQDEVNKIVGERLAREKQQAADDKKKADMTEAEKLKAAKDEAESKSKEAITKADQRIVRTEAKVALIAAGANPTRVDALVKLADLSAVSIGEDGEPDAKALKSAVDTTLKDYPEFKAGASNGKSGADFSGGNPNDKPLSDEVIGNMKPDELKRRMPEVEAYFESKRKR